MKSIIESEATFENNSDMKKSWLAGLMTHQYKKLPETMKMWMQFNVMP